METLNVKLSNLSDSVAIHIPHAKSGHVFSYKEISDAISLENKSISIFDSAKKLTKRYNAVSTKSSLTIILDAMIINDVSHDMYIGDSLLAYDLPNKFNTTKIYSFAFEIDGCFGNDNSYSLKIHRFKGPIKAQSSEENLTTEVIPIDKFLEKDGAQFLLPKKHIDIFYENSLEKEPGYVGKYIFHYSAFLIPSTLVTCCLNDTYFKQFPIKKMIISI